MRKLMTRKYRPGPSMNSQTPERPPLFIETSKKIIRESVILRHEITHQIVAVQTIIPDNACDEVVPGTKWLLVHQHLPDQGFRKWVAGMTAPLVFQTAVNIPTDFAAHQPGPDDLFHCLIGL